MTKTIRRTALFAFAQFFLTCGSVLSSQGQSFDLVWRTVADEYFDPSIGGRDWEGIGREYRARLPKTSTVDQFVRLANEMLFELGHSHLLVVRATDLVRFVPEVYAAGTLGLETRVIDGNAVVIAVRAGSPAARAGVPVSAVLDAIDDTATSDLLTQAETELIPPFNPRNRRNILVRLLWGHLYGPPGSEITIAFHRADREAEALTLRRQSRGMGRVHGDILPAYFIEFEARVLQGGIGYIRFNHFAPPVDDQFAAALSDGLATAPGLIIDLRGNSGGFFDVVDKIAGQLMHQHTELYAIRTREGDGIRSIAGSPGAYAGPVVVLVDETTMSAAETFAGALQAIGRVTVVGMRTPGYVLAADWRRLPSGLLMMYAIGQPRLADDTVLEDRGVVPNLTKSLDRSSLAAGRDAQLEAAMEFLAQGAGSR